MYLHSERCPPTDYPKTCRENPVMSTSQRVWLVVLLTIFGGTAVEQLMDMDTLPSVVVGVVAAVLIAIGTGIALLGKKPVPCPVPSDVDHHASLRRR